MPNLLPPDDETTVEQNCLPKAHDADFHTLDHRFWQAMYLEISKTAQVFPKLAISIAI